MNSFRPQPKVFFTTKKVSPLSYTQYLLFLVHLCVLSVCQRHAYGISGK